MVGHDLDGFGNSGPGWPITRGDSDEHRHRYAAILTMPVAPNLALCLCCHWIASGPQVAERAAEHRNETSHAVLAGRHDG
jgi:hypothetical protein